MVVCNALRELADVLDEYDDGRVTRVESSGSSDGEMVLRAEIELPVATDPGDGDGTSFALTDAEVGSDGTLALSIASTAPVTSRPDAVTVEPGSVTLTGDGPATVTLTTSVPVGRDPAEANESDRDIASLDDDVGVDDAPAGNGDVARETGGTAASSRDSDVPPFRDPDLLAEVYESCDTFAEMTDELGMDVTAETVRRYMVDHGIHQPNSYETSDRSDDRGDDRADAPAADPGEDVQSQVALPDGIGLPDDVTVDSFIETIKRSNTIYEVKREIGIEQKDALDMLKRLNLIDLVVGRLATEGEREIQREDIVERLREASENQQ
ncbi:MAG: hypothetical protein ABEJ22_06095 [Haloferacaceae archaeon]